MKNMKISLGLFAAFAALPSISLAVTADESLAARISVCSSNNKDADRLACFDSLASSLTNPSVEETGEPNALPENLGGGRFDKRDDAKQVNRGRVTSCKKSHDGRWFFIFDNGQIWKQANLDRPARRYKACEFDVVISKDTFGYKMFIEKLSRKVRVKRLK